MNLKSKILKQLKPYSWWIQNTLTRKESKKNRNILNKADKILFEIEKKKDKKQYQVLKKKFESLKMERKNYTSVESKNLNESDIEKIEKFFDYFIELTVYKELENRGFKNIQFLPESKTKTPDIMACFNGKYYYIEVKNIRKSKKERNALWKGKEGENLANKILPRNFADNFESFKTKVKNGIKKKIESCIKDANEKFKNVEKSNIEIKKILVINYIEGYEVWCIERRDNLRNLRGVLGNDYFNKLEKENKISIWTRKYL